MVVYSLDDETGSVSASGVGVTDLPTPCSELEADESVLGRRR